MQTNWDSNHTPQQRSLCCPQRVPKQGSSTATAATTLHPAAHLQCAMALPSQDTGSPSLCQSLLSHPHPPVIGNAERSPYQDTGVGHSTAVHGQKLIWAQSFTPIPLANHTASSPSAGAKANLVPCPPGASGPTWVCRAGLLSPGVASLLCG